jgi:perosamine synthetase
MPEVRPLAAHSAAFHAYHLYVVQLDLAGLCCDRGTAFSFLHDQGIGVNVHYIPVHLHSYYRRRLGTAPGLCPVAESAYERILSLPIFPSMSDGDVEAVTEALSKLVEIYRR